MPIEEIALTGGKSRIESWPEPIYPGANKETCPICIETPMICPVVIQCGHVLCNSCIQDIMGASRAESLCPVCRRQIYEYRSLRSRRIRRPIDRTAWRPNEDYYVQMSRDDPDYQPRRSLEARIDRESSEAGEAERHQSAEPEPATRSQHVDSQADRSRSPPSQRVNLSIRQPDNLQSQSSSGSSVIFIGEFRSPHDNHAESQHDENEPTLQIAPYQPQSQHLSPKRFRSDQRSTQDRANHQLPGPSRPMLEFASEYARQIGSHEASRAFVLVDIEKIVDHRGKGPNIRYLVKYVDGQQIWEPLAHLDWCPIALDRYRKAKKVINQTNYRRRLRYGQQLAGGR